MNPLTTLPLPETFEGTATVQGEFLELIDKTIAQFESEEPILTGEALMDEWNNLNSLRVRLERRAFTKLTPLVLEYELKGGVSDSFTSLLDRNVPWSWRTGLNGDQVESLCFHAGDPSKREVTVRMRHENESPDWTAGRTQVMDKLQQISEDRAEISLVRSVVYETLEEVPSLEYWVTRQNGRTLQRGKVTLKYDETKGRYLPTNIEFVSSGPGSTNGNLCIDEIGPEAENVFIEEVASRLCPILTVSTN